MKTTKQSIQDALNKKAKYLASQLLVYRTVTDIMKDYHGKKLPSKNKLAEIVDEQLLQFHSYGFKDDHYIRLQVNRIGQIYSDQQYSIVIHYARDGEKFDFAKFTPQNQITKIQNELFIVKQMLASESEKKIKVYLMFLESFREEIRDFHALVESGDFHLYKHFIDAEELALITETKELR